LLDAGGEGGKQANHDGLALDLPFTFLDHTGGTLSSNAIDVGNPKLVFEVENRVPEGLRVFGFGFGLPLASLSDNSREMGLSLENYAVASATRGGADLVLWAPDRFSVLADLQARYRFHPLFMEGAVSLSGLFSTTDKDVDFHSGGWAHFGLDVASVIPFLGVTFSWLPTADRNPIDAGVQLGAMVELGALELQILAQLNIKEVFSFNDGGVFGVRIGAQRTF